MKSLGRTLIIVFTMMAFSLSASAASVDQKHKHKKKPKVDLNIHYNSNPRDSDRASLAARKITSKKRVIKPLTVNEEKNVTSTQQKALSPTLTTVSTGLSF